LEPEEKTRYEVEVMLGSLDESHIIRAIEYWDIERRRYPNVEHRAVIVTEDITNRFFNVISLLNKAVPIIALQLNAIVIDENLLLNFVKVLDLVQEEDPDAEGGDDPVTRTDWTKRASESSLKIMDAMIAIVTKSTPNPKVTYNRGHVALGTKGTNFLWFHPRKGSSLHCEMKIGADKRQEIVDTFEKKGLESKLRGQQNVSLILTENELGQYKEIITEALKLAEQNSLK
jgi:hypothetical protein